MEPSRPLPTLLKAQSLQEVVDGRIFVGQKEVETSAFGAVEQSEGLKLIAAVILIIARLGHHRDLFLRARERIKRFVLRQLLFELLLPLALKIDGVNQEHDVVGIDPVNDRRNFALRIPAHPVIDSGQRAWRVEVERGDLGAEELAMGVALLERRRLPEKSGILPKLPIAERGLRGRYELQTIS